MHIVHVSIYSRLGVGFAPIISLPLFSRVVFVAVYYNNIWDSKNFPFVCTIHLSLSLCTQTEQLSQELFSAEGTIYNQTLILNSNFEVDPKLLAQQGLVCHLFDLKFLDAVLTLFFWRSHFLLGPASSS